MWKNWARTAACSPERSEVPRNTGEIAELIRSARAAGRRVKAVGSGHSFTDIACTDGIHVEMRNFQGLLRHDASTNRATLGAGTRISDAAEALARVGLGFSNLGDIGYQTVAGAIATGTHGTSAVRPSIPGQLTGLVLVSGTGEIIECDSSKNPDVFAAARVGLGALGVVTEATVQAERAFNLETKAARVDLDSLLDGLDTYVDENDHFEFFWFPHTDVALATVHNRSDAPERQPKPLKDWFYTVVVANYVWEVYLRLGRRRPHMIPRINRRLVGDGTRSRAERSIPARGRVSRSDRAFTNERRVRFAEMEYNVPRGEIVPVLRRVRRAIEGLGLRISFPIEVRFGPAEDTWLSPAFGRESAWIAVHMFAGAPYDEYFDAVEAIVTEVGGRPHWGKLHSRTAATLRDLYPAWDDFQSLRRALDPDAVFANAYTDRVLGPVPARL